MSTASLKYFKKSALLTRTIFFYLTRKSLVWYRVFGGGLMRFGIAFSNRQRGLVERLSLLDDIVVKAEELGYASFLTTDHYMLPWGNETLETWVYLSYLAGKVSNIRLGTCVTPISFRPPSLLAKTISTLDLVSNGKVIVGVGLGWNQDEFEAYSIWDPNPVRFEKTKEALELMVKLWSEDKIDFDGKYYRAKGAALEPKPVQKPHPPLWFGGAAKECSNSQPRWEMD
jgi:alkanesulfonate monooxygenase SsuD/methylene tetrahydromethanopterin reductase-like flavin-dependent oxidoreductase (luciferase family)